MTLPEAKAREILAKPMPSAQFEYPEHTEYCEARALIAGIEQERERVKVLMPYLTHDMKCILAQWQAGEPTPDGGYRTMYAGRWYQSKPVDETPECNCGLDEALAAYEAGRKGK